MPYAKRFYCNNQCLKSNFLKQTLSENLLVTMVKSCNIVARFVKRYPTFCASILACSFDTYLLIEVVFQLVCRLGSVHRFFEVYERQVNVILLRLRVMCDGRRWHGSS